MALEITHPVPGTPEMESVEKIWMEAFPPAERIAGLDVLLSIEHSHINAYYDEGRMVGFYLWFDIDWFDYGLLFAVDSTCRGGGYGGKIWDTILAEHTTRPFYFSVEDPDETPADNAEQRKKRVAFYERHGCALTDQTYLENPRFRLMYYHSPERAQQALAELYNMYQKIANL